MKTQNKKVVIELTLNQAKLLTVIVGKFAPKEDHIQGEVKIMQDELYKIFNVIFNQSFGGGDEIFYTKTNGYDDTAKLLKKYNFMWKG